LERQPSQPKTGTTPAFTASSQPSIAATKKFGMPIVTPMRAVAIRSKRLPLHSAAKTPNGTPNKNAQPSASNTSSSVTGPCSRRIELTVRYSKVKVGPRSNRASERM
jgi:hypothetical protein